MIARALSTHEVRQLVLAARQRRHGNGVRYRHAQRDALILELMIETGMRAEEVCRASHADVRSTFIVIEGRRWVALPGTLGSRLDAYCQRHRLSFDRPMFMLSPRSVTGLVGHYGRLAGIERERTLAPSDLRRTFVSRAFPRRTNSARELAFALGTSTATAMRYVAAAS